MAGIARGNGIDTVITGHACDNVTVTDQCSSNVFVNGYGACRVGDNLHIHNINIHNVCTPHTAQIIHGSNVVFVNGLPVARVWDRADHGYITSGSINVFAGDGFFYIITQDGSPVITQDDNFIIGS